MRSRINGLERKHCKPTRYFRLWNPASTYPHRRLLCFKYTPGTYQVEISEKEYQDATGELVSNQELESLCGQG